MCQAIPAGNEERSLSLGFKRVGKQTFNSKVYNSESTCGTCPRVPMFVAHMPFGGTLPFTKQYSAKNVP